MAKRKRSRRRAPARRVVRTRRAPARRAPRRRRSSKRFGMKKLVGQAAMGAGYGVVRGPMNQLLAPIASKIPLLGDLGDEAALLVADVLIAKNSSGVVRDLATTGVTVEAFAIGSALGNRLLSGALGGGSAGASTGNASFR